MRILISDIKAILFDVDDTLFDRAQAQLKVLYKIVDALPGLFSALDFERVAEAFLESDRLTTNDFNAGAMSTYLRDSRSKLFLKLLEIAESYANDITEIYVRDYPNVYAPAGSAISVIKELSKKYQIGAVSNGLSDVQYRKLDTLGLRNILSCIVLSEEIGIRKPEPAIFLCAAQSLGRRPDECLFVGDSYTSDVVGAKNAGMYTCWFNPAKLPVQSKEMKPDFMVYDLLDVLEILKMDSPSGLE
jgi:HAD superfamily hydrolase (TIGR01509 family)